MAKGNEIIVTAEPRGTFDEGIITDTSKPGTFMEIVPATAPVGGRFSWRARSLTAGSKGPLVILLNDSEQGKTSADAYVSGTRCRLYWLCAGEEYNVRVADVAGTADDVAIGDLFGVDATGKAKANAGYASAPLQALEVKTDPTAEYLLWVKCLGHLA